MTIADRILELRKAKGISQEQLADCIGVSRQAVSKWESEQSIPDIDKVIIMSDFFEVTTDYLLKGIEPQTERKKDNKAINYVFNIVATAMIYLGFLFTEFLWIAEQDIGSIIGGMVFIILGIMLFAVGIYWAKDKDRILATAKFLKMNIWPVSFIVLSIIYNLIFEQMIAPYPLLNWGILHFAKFALFWIAYIAICGTVTYLQIKKEKTEK
ncbi:MAG: helix-turn-helix domain-containing protein [Eubacterium sp.]|nr:helix-turn-helix domain-containing protein [Eubacterium sp.]